MASKLFHAIVGFGLALGSSGCAIVVDPATDAGAESADSATSPATDHDSSAIDTGAVDTGADEDSSVADTTMADTFVAETAVADTSVADTAVVDTAVADAPDADAMHDAFCDLAWPTTKGAPHGPPACADPTGACAMKPASVTCVQSRGPGMCDGPSFYPVCKGGDWGCPAGQLPATSCICWGAPPTDADPCTDTGWAAVDTGVDADPDADADAP